MSQLLLGGLCELDRFLPEQTFCVKSRGVRLNSSLDVPPKLGPVFAPASTREAAPPSGRLDGSTHKAPEQGWDIATVAPTTVHICNSTVSHVLPMVLLLLVLQEALHRPLSPGRLKAAPVRAVRVSHSGLHQDIAMMSMCCSPLHSGGRVHLRHNCRPQTARLDGAPLPRGPSGRRCPTERWWCPPTRVRPAQSWIRRRKKGENLDSVSTDPPCAAV